MASGNQMSVKWLEMVSSFHEMFGEKIEKEIIQMVVQNSEDENTAFMHLQTMLDDFITPELPSKTPSRHQTSVIQDPRTAANGDCIVVSDTCCEINVDHITQHYAVKKPGNLLEQLSLSTVPSVDKKPGNLLEQLSLSSVPPADLNLVMSSSSSSGYQNPVTTLTSSTAPTNSYSLFGAPPGPSPLQQTLLPSSESGDYLFSQNPYLVSTSLFNHPFETTSNEEERRKEKCNAENAKTVSDVINDQTRRVMVLMRGLPGSGKSYKARQLCGCKGVIYSTDDYFLNSGVYHFEPRLLQNAHLWNQDRAKKAVRAGVTPIFIDNTNIQVWEMKPYIVMAMKNKYKVEVVEPDTWWAWNPTQLVRTNTHGVPKSKIEIMKDRYEKIKGNCIESMLTLRSQPNSGSTIPPVEGNARTRVVKTYEEERNNRDRNVTIEIQSEECNDMQNMSVGTEVDIVDIDHVSPLRVATNTPTPNNTDTPLVVNSAPFANNIIDSVNPNSISTSTPAKHTEFVLGQKRLFSHGELDIIPGTEVRNETENSIAENEKTVVRSNSVELLEDGTRNSNDGDKIDFNMLSNEIDDIEMTECLAENVAGKQDAKTKENDEDNAVVFTEPTHISRQSSQLSVINVENETAVNMSEKNKSSPGNIVDLVNSYKSCTDESNSGKQSSPSIEGNFDDTNLIDLTDDSFSKTSYKRTQFDFNLQFISECFPDFKFSYCRDWLKRYNGDLVKTCDYLSRCSQVEELPDDPNVPCIEELLPKQKFPEGNISLDDIFENKSNTDMEEDGNNRKLVSIKKAPCDILCNKDEEADHTLVLTPPRSTEDTDTLPSIKDKEPGNERPLNCEGTQTAFEEVIVEQGESLIPCGELFLHENEKDSKSKTPVDKLEKNRPISIALDANLAKELIKLFGQPALTDEFRSDDLVISLKKDVGKLIYDAWIESISSRKCVKETHIQDDEMFAKQLQNEDLERVKDQLNYLADDKMYAMQLQNEEDKVNGLSEGKKKKSKKKDRKKIDTPFSNNQDDRIYDGSFEPTSPCNLGGQKLPIPLGGKENVNAKQLKLRKELYHRFPGVGEDALDNVLQYAGYDIGSAAAIVRNSCGLKENPTVQHVYASDVASSSKQIASPPRKKPNTNTSDMPGPSNSAMQPVSPSGDVMINPRVQINIPADDLYQTMTESKQTYQDFRAEAELHKNIRTEYFQKAAKAFQSKQGLLAQHYADKAQEHTHKMNEAHARAAELTLKVKNRQYMNEQQIIDFHGLHTDEALRALSNFISNARKLGYKSVFVITGRGNHSKKNFSTVRNVVMQTLTKHNYKFKLHSNGGMLEVFLK